MWVWEVYFPNLQDRISSQNIVCLFVCLFSVFSLVYSWTSGTYFLTLKRGEGEMAGNNSFVIFLSVFCLRVVFAQIIILIGLFLANLDERVCKYILPFSSFWSNYGYKIRTFLLGLGETCPQLSNSFQKEYTCNTFKIFLWLSLEISLIFEKKENFWRCTAFHTDYLEDQSHRYVNKTTINIFFV